MLSIKSRGFVDLGAVQPIPPAEATSPRRAVRRESSASYRAAFLPISTIFLRRPSRSDPANPISSIAHVEGSGTAATAKGRRVLTITDQPIWIDPV